MSQIVLDGAANNGNKIRKNCDFTNANSSFYALQVALQTMKERCQQLQQRLSTVEEENLRLRIEKQRHPISGLADESKEEVNTLKEHIAQLTRQKSQLTHHIYMVATENKQLWTRLSRLTEANHSLGSHLTKISDTLNRHSLAEVTKPNESINIMTNCENEADKLGGNGTCVEKDRDASLEEISLKIISSIIREKMELEQQCDQMSALQHSAVVSLEECGFGVGGAGPEAGGGGGETGWRGADELGRVLEGAHDARDELRRQQARLRTTLAALTRATAAVATVQGGTMPCKQCEVRKETTDSDSNNQVRTADTNDDVDADDRVCPLCGRVFVRSTEFDEFHTHVLTHFSDEDADDYEMLD